MRIRMKVQVSGMRNGTPWPPVGTVVELPDDEARQYCEAGMAAPASEDRVETATMPADEEKRPTLTTKTGPATKRRR